jgi:hypothetical protein
MFHYGCLNSRKRHGNSLYTLGGNELSANKEAAKNFVVEFSEFVADRHECLRQVYSMDEAALFWKYMLENSLCNAGDLHTGIKES